jgi:hypothetical protein
VLRTGQKGEVVALQQQGVERPRRAWWQGLNETHPGVVAAVARRLHRARGGVHAQDVLGYGCLGHSVAPSLGSPGS